MQESIWFRDYRLSELAPLCQDNMLETLGVQLTQLGPETLVGTMPVDHRTCQPAGLLHGGASVALAESLGSIAANLCIDPEKFACVGQEVNASHVRPVRSGRVTGTARPEYLGRTSQVWQIRVTDERERLVCSCRLTVAVVARGHGGGKTNVLSDEC